MSSSVRNPQIIAQTALRILEHELLEHFIADVRKQPRAPWVKQAMAIWFAKVAADLERTAIEPPPVYKRG